MAMTLRMTPETENALREVATATHRSLNDAAQVAILDARQRLTVQERYRIALANVDRRDAEAMDLLSR